jgi:signal transduction histidine kinase
VADTGIGIAPEHQLLIFDRFYRASKAGEALPTGSGLGLALAKWIAERHGTELSVESDLGHGSIFSFSLQKISDDLSVFGSSGLSCRSSDGGSQSPSLAH